MNIKYLLIDIPWGLLFCILLAIALYVKFYYDTKHLNNLKQLLEKSKYDDAFAVNVYKKYIKNHKLYITSKY